VKPSALSRQKGLKAERKHMTRNGDESDNDRSEYVATITREQAWAKNENHAEASNVNRDEVSGTFWIYSAVAY